MRYLRLYMRGSASLQLKTGAIFEKSIRLDVKSEFSRRVFLNRLRLKKGNLGRIRSTLMGQKSSYKEKAPIIFMIYKYKLLKKLRNWRLPLAASLSSIWEKSFPDSKMRKFNKIIRCLWITRKLRKLIENIFAAFLLTERDLGFMIILFCRIVGVSRTNLLPCT